MEKPDVDYIEGLSPAISIEQKTTGRNPRSTVGTVTEIYDYFRLLFARIGVPHDPKSGKRVERQSVEEITDHVLAYPEGARVAVLAPVVRDKKGSHRKVLEDAGRAGFARVRIDGTIYRLDDELPELDGKRKHTIDIVVDRIKIHGESRKRVVEAVETACETGGGMVRILRQEREGESEESFSQNYAYPDSDLTVPELEPRLFSFNSPFGACPECSGLGLRLEFDRDLIIPNQELSFNDGGFVPYNPTSAWHRSRFESLAELLGFSLDQPIKDLTPETLDALFQGPRERMQVRYVNKNQTGRFEYETEFPGILADLRRRYTESSSEGVKEWLEGFMTQRVCEVCHGKRLRPEVLAVTVHGKSIYDLTALSVSEALAFFDGLSLTETEEQITHEIVKEIRSRLGFMLSVGLNYLTLDRRAGTLSGGEAQRIRLATQIGSSLVGVLYILDEPTIGLHQRDNARLLETLNHLRDIGNTLIVVEHDEQTLHSADHILDLGPGAGIHGGYLVAQGSVDEVSRCSESLTGQYLAGTLRIETPPERRRGSGKELAVRGAREHNLKGIDVGFPLGTFTAITGVSGSGKSTLLTEVFYPAMANRLYGGHRDTGACDGIDGAEEVDKVINIDQTPIGRTPRSNPATYVGAFGPIRELFAGLPEARARGYKPGRFSFNVKGGRCENCQGAGTIRIEMHFLPDVYVTCDHCGGKRFNRETLEIKYKGKSVYDVLEMTVEEAWSFFEAIPALARRLETLNAVGLDYVRLGQSAVTLSGGEAQRVKLSLELAKRSTGKTVYILDEPTTGLHFADVKQLLEVLNSLVDKGNTVIVIEHNLDVLKQADHLIDLGPEGGDEGGSIVGTGTPEEIARLSASHTGRFLSEVLG
jgi:excinuclease ABC subunit A